MPKNKYSISQNFLTSGRTISRLLTLTDLSKDDMVLEIGAGKGHITRALAQRCGRVLTCEIDPALIAMLRGALPENVRLHQGDFLRMPLPRGPYKVFANIPFNRTTDIIRRLTDAPHPPEAAWLIVEKGAAMRFSGAGQESLTSLSLKPWWEVRIVHRLRREDFHPLPSVDCVLLELRRKAPPDVPVKERRLWDSFVERAVRHGLRGLLTPRQIASALRQADVPMSATMRYVQWLCLFRCWRNL